MVRTFVGDSTMRSLDADFPALGPPEPLFRTLLPAEERFEAILFGVFLSFIDFLAPTGCFSGRHLRGNFPGERLLFPDLQSFAFRGRIPQI